jgi:hypothetical protein
MKNLVSSVESILGQYRAAQKQKSRGAETEGLQKLRELWPDCTYLYIRRYEWERRYNARKKEINAECKICDENGYVLDPDGKVDRKKNPIKRVCKPCEQHMIADAKVLWKQFLQEIGE